MTALGDVQSAATLAKAMLFLKPGTTGGLPRVELRCTFNPRELTLSKSAQWHLPPRPNNATPEPEFGGADPATLSMELLFDAWEKPAGDVSSDVLTLLRWTEPTPQSTSGEQRPNPPIVVFQWGRSNYGHYFLQSVSARYTMFRRDGTPVRALVSVTMKGIPNEPGPTNPTSGGPPGRRSVLVGAGDSLHSIAWTEYRDPRLWRALAVANGLDDPLRVGAGTRVVVPAHAEALDLIHAP